MFYAMKDEDAEGDHLMLKSGIRTCMHIAREGKNADSHVGKMG